MCPGGSGHGSQGRSDPQERLCQSDAKLSKLYSFLHLVANSELLPKVSMLRNLQLCFKGCDHPRNRVARSLSFGRALGASGVIELCISGLACAQEVLPRWQAMMVISRNCEMSETVDSAEPVHPSNDCYCLAMLQEWFQAMGVLGSSWGEATRMSDLYRGSRTTATTH